MINDDFKEAIGFIRDAAIVYFIGERIAKDSKNNIKTPKQQKQQNLVINFELDFFP